MSRLVFVTGGVRGIGGAICRHMKELGYRVVANNYKCETTSRQFTEATKIPVVGFDVSDPRACEQGVEQIFNEHGPIDILVLNAGITRDALLHKMSVEMWDDVIRTNLSSCFYVTRCVLPAMVEQGFGRIVCVSSINAFKGQRGQTNYASSKAGIVAFVKSLAQEVVSKGITVNAVAPGYTDTEMVQQVPQEILAKIVEQIPMKRLARVDEIARCVSFLAADEASFIIGETIHVNGGQLMS